MQFFVYFVVSEKTPMNPPTPEGMAKMSQFMADSFDAGTIVATGRLPRQTTHVELADGEFSISDGPFTEGKEVIPGFTVIETDSQEAAVEWVKELRACMGDGVLRMAKLSATSREDTKM
ncbi:MAG: YciI family protein [bacterium]|nr:YciI family protein [bacterium]